MGLESCLQQPQALVSPSRLNERKDTMTFTLKGFVALLLALAAWGVETRLITASYDLWSAQAHVVIIATIALAVVPLLLENAVGWNSHAGWLTTILIGAFVFVAVLDRSARPIDNQVAAMGAQVEVKDRLEADLAAAQARLADAEAEMKAESKRGGCGPRCTVWRQMAEGHQANVDRLTDKLAHLAPAVAYSPAKRFAAVTGLSEETLVMVLPAIQPVGFMILVCFLMSYWHKSWFGETVSKVSEPVKNVGGGGKSEDHEVIALKSALKGRRLSNDELAKYMKVGKAESSRRVTKAIDLGLVQRQRVGKTVEISLCAH